MNFGRWIKSARKWSSRSAVAVFGELAGGGVCHGTGFLVDFRGTPLVLTCWHVVDPIAGVIFLSSSRRSYQRDGVVDVIAYSQTLDLAVLRPNHAFSRGQKTFYPMSRCILGGVDPDTSVVLHGFPTGHPSVQRGRIVDFQNRTVTFRSLTYLSVTDQPDFNRTTRRRTPTIYWRQDENVSGKTFRSLGRSRRDPFVMPGCSGGPVFEGASGRLIGHATHIDQRQNRRIYYTPIDDSLRFLDSVIDPAVIP